MNTVVVRNGRSAARRNRRRRPARRVRPIIVVPTNRNTPRRGGRRRRNNRRSRGNGNASRRNKSDSFVFTKESINGNSTGSFTFGPALSDCKPFSNGILQACHEYKITMVKFQFVSEASTTTSGSITYELDTKCAKDKVESPINKFPIRTGGTKVYTAAQIKGVNWQESDTDQFRILYKGNGKAEIAGYFLIKFFYQTQNPK